MAHAQGRIVLCALRLQVFGVALDVARHQAPM
jgi:hypothetical protein